VTSANEILYDQPAGGSGGCSVGCIISTLPPDGNGFQAFGSFALSQTSIINGASWIGLYNTGNSTIVSSPDTISWNVSFWSDAGGQPGTPLSSQVVSEGTVTATFLGIGSFFGKNPIADYQFSASLAPFEATAGTTYWFSPLSLEGSNDTVFGWSSDTGAGDAGWVAGLGGFSGISENAGTDFAFSLTGVPVLEPDSAGLALLAGVGALAARFLSRRRSAIRARATADL
jgi:hypothetical protein